MLAFTKSAQLLRKEAGFSTCSTTSMAQTTSNWEVCWSDVSRSSVVVLRYSKEPDVDDEVDTEGGHTNAGS